MYHLRKLLRKFQIFGRMLSLSLPDFSSYTRRPSVLLDINQNINNRSLEDLLVFYQLGGYRVLLRGRIRDWQLGRTNALLRIPNTRFLWMGPRFFKPDIYCTDLENAPRVTGKTIHLRYDCEKPAQPRESHFYKPYPMLPLLYAKHQAHTRIQDLRGSRRKFRILFTGGFSEEHYKTPFVQQKFGVWPRGEIMAHLSADKRVVKITTIEELEELREGSYSRAMVLIDRRDFKIPHEEWLLHVSMADFFLCPPGIVMPYSHNATEAMAVGTIPLTNYANWFVPPMTNGEQCVTFSDEESLRGALDKILAMPETEILRLRREVTAYYDKHMCPRSFLRAMQEAPQENLVLHIQEENRLTRIMGSE